MPNLLLGVGKSGGGDGHVILTITADEDKALVTCQAAHGLSSATDINISGTKDYNANYLGVIQVTGPTTFNLGDASYIDDNTGGRWDLGAA